MQREISSFPLPSNQKIRLHNAGFCTVEDLENVKTSDLARELAFSITEAQEILEVVHGKPASSNNAAASSSEEQTQTPMQTTSSYPTPALIASRIRSCYEMLQEEQEEQGIITFSEAIDGLLGYGIPLEKVTEVCGVPGVGKTQLCMQLAVDVQIPEVFGGLGGTAMYIDTEGTLVVDRLREIATATLQHCEHIANTEKNPEQLAALTSFNMESILSNIHYFRCYDYFELVGLVHLLPKFVKQHPKVPVRLIIIDSIAFPFRHELVDLALRTRLLNRLAQNFIKLATLNKLAVVLTNQMTTKIGGGVGGAQIIPALGESWGHASTLRLLLQWRDDQRYALLTKSTSKQEASVPFQITMAGVRDVPTEEVAMEEELTDVSSEQPPPCKRQKTEGNNV